MSEIGLKEVVASFRRCAASGAFLDRFYQLFLASSAEVAEKFKNTDFPRQRQALEESLHTLLLGGKDIPESGVIRRHLERIARRHGREQLDIRPELYDLWLDCLIQAVREHDPQCDEALADAWREAMRPGIGFMRSRH